MCKAVIFGRGAIVFAMAIFCNVAHGRDTNATDRGAADSGSAQLMLAQAASAASAAAETKKEPTPEEKMRARFPQPVKVGHLIGLPVLDGGDSTIGYVQQVVRTSDGKVKLIVPYGARFGWARDGQWLSGGRRPVAVPIETVALLALQINAVDMDRGAFANAPTWTSEQTEPIPPGETIKIALGRR